jgi:hypothetical protein
MKTEESKSTICQLVAVWHPTFICGKCWCSLRGQFHNLDSILEKHPYLNAFEENFRKQPKCSLFEFQTGGATVLYRTTVPLPDSDPMRSTYNGEIRSRPNCGSEKSRRDRRAANYAYILVEQHHLKKQKRRKLEEQNMSH